MELEISRYSFGPHQCAGYLEVNGEHFCDTLEPRAINWKKERKKAKLTAIPEGRYRIEIAVSAKFKRRMPYLKDVPNFSGIMIHTGNVATKPDGTPGDSQGCILVGYCSKDNGVLSQSRACFDKLMGMLEAANKRGEAVWVTVSSPKKWTYNK